MSSKTKILILSDQPYLENVLKQQQNSDEMYHIQTVSQSDFLEKSTNGDQKPQLVILEYRNESLFVETREQFDTTPMIAIANNITDANLSQKNIHPLEKPFTIHTLFQLIEKLLSFEAEIEIGNVLFSSEESSLKIKETSLKIDLTEKESLLIQALISADGKIVPKKALLEDIWQHHQDVDSKTLETHIYRLRQKLIEAGYEEELIVSGNGGYRI